MIGKISFIFFGLILLGAGFRFFRRYRQIEDKPTSKISTAAQGHVELRGKVLALDQPLYTNHHGQKVIYRKYEVWEETRRNGKRESKKGRSGIYGHKFYLEDLSGVVEVFIEDFEIFAPRVTFPYVQLVDEKLPAEYKKVEVAFAVLNAIDDFTEGKHNKQVYEWSIPVGSEIFLQGELKACTKSVGNKAILGSVYPHKEKTSFVSTKTEKEIVSTEKIKSFAMIAAGAGLLFFGIVGKFQN